MTVMHGRTLVAGPRGSGKSARLQAWAQEREGLYVPANPHALMTGLVPTVAQEIALGLEPLVAHREQLHSVVQGLAADLEISDLLGANPLKLSGGQTQLVALAAYLALGQVRAGGGGEAPLLAVDEPFLGSDEAKADLLLTAFDTYPGPLAWASARPSPGEYRLALTLEERTGAAPPAPSLPALRERISASVLVDSLAIAPETARRRRPSRAAAPIAYDISFSLEPGTCLLLTGPNGSGKTTLLRTLAGLLPPAAGSFTVGGQEPYTLPGPARVALTQLVAQSPDHHFLASTVSADVRLGAGVAAQEGESGALVTAVLGSGYGQTHPLDLLPAEQHLLALTEVVAAAPCCLLADEPTAALDAAGLHQAASLIAAHCAAGGSAVIATHDTELARLLTCTLNARVLNMRPGA